MARIWQVIQSYVWWTHERGSVPYDVMVTIILLFIFLAPHWISFNDKPTERTLHQTGVVVLPDAEGLLFQVDASAVSGTAEAEIRERLVRVIEPVAGEIELVRYEAVPDAEGHVKSYKAWVRRPYR
jgi:hypothetical protein